MEASKRKPADGAPLSEATDHRRFFVDFYCHACGLAIEIDGSVHNEQKDYDQNRDEILNRYGIRVLRITDEEVQNDLQSVLHKIIAA